MVGHSRRGEVLRDDGRRKQFAEGDDRVVPQLGVGRTVLRLGGDAIQFGEQRLDPFQTGRAVPEVVDDRGVIFAQPCDLGSGFFAVAPLHPLEHPFQRIGRLAHRRDDDEEVLFVVDDIAQVAHPLSIADRCSAEFIDLHILVSRFTLFEPSCCSTAHGRCADTNIPSPLSPPFDKGRGLRRIGLHLFHPAPRQSADRYPDALLLFKSTLPLFPVLPYSSHRAVQLRITTAPLSGVRTFYFINIIRPYHPRFDTRSGTARTGAVNQPSPTFNSPAPIVRTSSPYCRTGKRSCRPIRRYASRAVCPRRGRHSVRCGSAPEHRTPAHIGASQRI